MSSSWPLARHFAVRRPLRGAVYAGSHTGRTTVVRYSYSQAATYRSDTLYLLRPRSGFRPCRQSTSRSGHVLLLFVIDTRIHTQGCPSMTPFHRNSDQALFGTTTRFRCCYSNLDTYSLFCIACAVSSVTSTYWLCPLLFHLAVIIASPLSVAVTTTRS